MSNPTCETGGCPCARPTTPTEILIEPEGVFIRADFVQVLLNAVDEYYFNECDASIDQLEIAVKAVRDRLAEAEREAAS